MKKRIDSTIDRICKMVQATTVRDDEKQVTVDRLRKLPPLCEAFCKTYESRDVEEILRVERAVLRPLADPSQGSPQSAVLAKVLRIQLGKLHELLGLPRFDHRSGTASSKARK